MRGKNDDVEVNVAAARQAGFHAVHFESPKQLDDLLRGYEILSGDAGS